MELNALSVPAVSGSRSSPVPGRQGSSSFLLLEVKLTQLPLDLYPADGIKNLRIPGKQTSFYFSKYCENKTQGLCQLHRKDSAVRAGFFSARYSTKHLIFGNIYVTLGDTMGRFCVLTEQFQAIHIFSPKERDAVLIWRAGDFVHFLSNRHLCFFRVCIIDIRRHS